MFYLFFRKFRKMPYDAFYSTLSSQGRKYYNNLKYSGVVQSLVFLNNLT